MKFVRLTLMVLVLILALVPAVVVSRHNTELTHNLDRMEMLAGLAASFYPYTDPIEKDESYQALRGAIDGTREIEFVSVGDARAIRVPIGNGEAFYRYEVGNLVFGIRTTDTGTPRLTNAADAGWTITSAPAQ